MDKQLVVQSKKTPLSFGRLSQIFLSTQDASVQGNGKEDAFVQEESKLDEDKLDDNVDNLNNPLI